MWFKDNRYRTCIVDKYIIIYSAYLTLSLVSFFLTINHIVSDINCSTSNIFHTSKELYFHILLVALCILYKEKTSWNDPFDLDDSVKHQCQFQISVQPHWLQYLINHRWSILFFQSSQSLLKFTLRADPHGTWLFLPKRFFNLLDRSVKLRVLESQNDTTCGLRRVLPRPDIRYEVAVRFHRKPPIRPIGEVAPEYRVLQVWYFVAILRPVCWI